MKSLDQITWVSLLAILLTAPLGGQEPLDQKATTRPDQPLSAEDRQLLAKAKQLHAEGVARFQQHKFPEAIEKYSESLRIRQEILGTEDLQTASTMAYLAQAHRAAGDYAAAEKLYEQTLAVNEKLLGTEDLGTATSLNNLALVCGLRGDDQKAKTLHERALAIRVKKLPPKHTSIATSLNNLASSFRGLGNYGKAEPLLEQALEIRESIDGKDHPSTAGILNNLAVLHMWQGNYGQAKLLNERSWKIIRQAKGDDSSEAATCLYNLAMLATITGDYSQAESKYQDALAVFKESLPPNHPTMARVEAELGLLYTAMGQLAKALPLCEHSLDMTSTALGEENPNTLRLRGNLAVLYHRLGKDDEAEQLHQACLQIRTKVLGAGHFETATSHFNLAGLYQDQGDFAKAEHQYASALAIYQQVLGDKHSETARSLNELGLLKLILGRPEDARSMIGHSLRFRRELLDVTSQVQTERQQLLMNQDVRSTLDDWLSLPSVDHVAAYAEVLRWKGAVFVRQVALRESRSQPELEPLVEKLRSVSSRLAGFALKLPEAGQLQTYQAQLRKLSDEREQLEAELSQKSPPHRRDLQLARLAPQELQAVLPEKFALVDILEYDRFKPPSRDSLRQPHRERHVVAFVVRRDRDEIQRIELGSAKQIDQWVDRWRKESRDTPNSPLTEPARELRRIVWLPLQPHLDGVDTVLISPDGSLGKLPFAALPGEKPESYLLEDLAVSVIPVPQTLVSMLNPTPQMDQRPENKQRMLVLGGVNYDGDAGTARKTTKSFKTRAGTGLQFAALEETLDEASHIGQLFREYLTEKEIGSSGKLNFLQKNEATEEMVRQLASECEFLHFATHGFFALPEVVSVLERRHDDDRGSPLPGEPDMFLGYPMGLLSGIVLAGANQPRNGGDDGILTALEIAEMDLAHVKLAVLSACETGLGRIAGGEGLLGLQRSFQLAGAQRVIGTLWDVKDESTRKLMERFYKNYLTNDELTTLGCLREAQLYMLNTEQVRGLRLGSAAATVKKPRTAPVNWAAFVLSGDWR